MMSWIRSLSSRRGQEAKQEPPYTLICSACLSRCSVIDAHVIPWWNPDEQSIFTTYRCGNCWLQSLKESQTAVNSKDPAVVVSFCDFLTRQGSSGHYGSLRRRNEKDADAIRLASPDQARVVLLTVLDAVREERLLFNP